MLNRSRISNRRNDGSFRGNLVLKHRTESLTVPTTPDRPPHRTGGGLLAVALALTVWGLPAASAGAETLSATDGPAAIAAAGAAAAASAPSAAPTSPREQGAPGAGDLQDFSSQQDAGASGGLTDFDWARERGLFWMYLAAFIGGIVISLTPCVLPVIPLTITVIGARGAGSRAKAFGLSFVYVLGIAFTYSTLGVVAASTGALFGSLFQSTWFLVFAIALFTLLAFGLFGAYELQLPAGIRNRLMAKQGSGLGGVFFMGLIAGLVASPCVGPVLVGVLAFIAQTGSIVLGFTLLFTFAMGMGVLFLVVGTFSGEIKRLPTGPWMTAVENGLGVLMMAVSFYYLSILVDDFTFALLFGAALVVGGTFVGAFLRLGAETPGWGPRARKALGILSVAAGLYFFVGGMMTYGLLLPPMSGVGTAVGTAADGTGAGGIDSAEAGLEWSEDLEAALLLAGIEQRPVMIDFTADWCVACKELDHFTFSDPDVVSVLQDFLLVRIDMTDQATPKNREYQRRYEIYGLPSVTFLTPDGTMLEDLTVTGFVNAERFLGILRQVQEASGN
jgi:thiol:disulfide interchange protein DsbD